MMPDVRCPNCGKTNPQGREVCDFCEAPLPAAPPPGKDSPSSTPADATPPGEDQDAQDLPGDAGSEEDAGWLDVLHASEEDIPEEKVPEAGFEEEVPEAEFEEEAEGDWLQRIRDLEVGDKDRADDIQEGDAFPAWMSEDEGEEPEKPAPQQEQELPDWLQPDEEDLIPQEPEPASEVKEEELAPEDAGEPAKPEIEGDISEPAPAEEGEFPAWLSDEDTPPQEEQPVPEGQEGIDPFQLDEDDDYYDDLFDEELPSWLTAVDEEEDVVSDEDISPGELPGWVEAMRPVVESSDTTGLPEDEEYIENYGPLAGIPSVLPAEPEIEQVEPEEKSKHALELSISKTQREYASLLNEVIAEERKVQPVSKPGRIPTQRILRWIVALVLLLSVGASIVAGGGGEGQPAGQNQERNAGYVEMHQMVEGLDEGDTALIVFDYQPALAGEMEATAAGVVDHIMQRGAYLALVSTQPTGPSLGEHFLASTQAQHDYQHGRDYINLGYIPGQAAGILGFSSRPREIIPIAFNGGNAWGSPPLQEIQALADFSAILILTDDPATARIWIEQIIHFIPKEKVGMVVSAQAEPLVRPYFENSPQLISGLVAGLRGGTAYENLTGTPHQSSAYWFSLNVGIIVTVLTIFIGGLANGILNLIKQRQDHRQGKGS